MQRTVETVIQIAPAIRPLIAKVRLNRKRMNVENLEQTISLLFEATKIMIPVLTGFVALFGAAFGRLWERSRDEGSLSISWSLAGLVVAAIVISLAFFCGVMALAIKASVGGSQDFLWWTLSREESIELARDYLAWGYSAFITAIAFCTIFFIRVWRS